MSDAVVADREAGLPAFKTESLEAVANWANEVGVDPAEMLESPLVALAAVDRMLGNEDISQLSDDEFTWLGARLLNYIGAVYIWRFDGEWVVDDRPDSPSYTAYVVRGSNGKHYEPGRAAIDFLNAPAPRELIAHIAAGEAAAT